VVKTFVMATDLSARSDRALARALALAREQAAHLTVVHVVDDALPASVADAQATSARSAIRAHVQDLTGGDSETVSVAIVFGRAFSGILEVAEKAEAEMIVLGTHREDSFKDMFRGTTAERVIRAGNTPALVVTERVARPYRHIMIGVDFSVYSRRAVEFAVAFAPGGTFHLVHAYDVPFKGFLHGKDARDGVSKKDELGFERMVDAEMARFIAGVDGAPRFEQVIAEGMARDVMHREIERLKPDLLVIGTHGRTGVAHAFLGSVAEDMLSNPPCDVLAVKAW